jgi:hypothetical protein
MGCTSSKAANPSETALPKEIVSQGIRNFTFKVEGKEDGQGYFAEKGRDSKMGIILI